MGLVDEIEPFQISHDIDTIYCTQTSEKYSLFDLMKERVWFPAKGKAGGGVTFGPPHERVGWRHSRSPNVGDVELARFGGRIEELEIKPWESLFDTVKVIEGYQKTRKIGFEWKPVMSLAGNEKFPCQHNVGVLDLDVKGEYETKETEPTRIKVLQAILACWAPGVAIHVQARLPCFVPRGRQQRRIV